MRAGPQFAGFCIVGFSLVTAGVVSLAKGYPTETFPDGTVIKYPKINWQQEIGGKWYAVQQYPKEASLPGLGTKSMSIISVDKFANIRSEGDVFYIEPREEGASSVVASIQVANHSFHLPLRFEFCLIILGLFTLTLHDKN
ncbi:hypothetical protein [Roseibacillus ishigakijimensis]|uniref:Uncharacterized protein n=1 Tax=Roseibacillus ishigakijimensis TaxID=454146 RepID=A0A934VJ19_9BACT|nr:hypothetical protein [Roseibacillus ishigakijimensis]MBK1835683.1 hypothetical protein [Roseibacillus ishigakijimensis]